MADEQLEEEGLEIPEIDPDDVVVKAPKKRIPGVKQSVAKKVYSMLEDGRRHFGSAGASMTHQALNYEGEFEIKKDKVNDALEAERKISDFLRDWAKDKPAVVIVDSVRANTSFNEPDTIQDEESFDEELGVVDTIDTDHIIFIGDFVVLVDTKTWRGKRTYTLSQEGEVIRSGKPFPGNRIRLNHEIYVWRDYLDYDATLMSIVCPTEEEVTVVRNLQWFQQTFRLVELARLKEFLDEVYVESASDNERMTINSTLVAQAVVCAIKPFDPYTKVLNEKALRRM